MMTRRLDGQAPCFSGSGEVFCVAFRGEMLYTVPTGRTLEIPGSCGPESAGKKTSSPADTGPLSDPDPGFAGVRVLTTSSKRTKINEP
jgi:hypothetical protein